MTDLMEAVDGYVRGTAPQPDVPPSQPEWVRMPVRDRVTGLVDGSIDPRNWAAVADDWAQQADARYRGCVELHPTTSAVRVGVKDTVDVVGYPTRLGLRHYRHYPRRSARALDALGAPVAGAPVAAVNAKVVTTELNIGLRPGCVNPYFPHIDPAGSSTGSGVAVAAGICDLSLATDVLGSARWPAGRCGVVGLRVTHDRHRLDGVFPLSPSMDAPGWIARTVDDLAFLWPLTGLRGGPSTGGPRRVGLLAEVDEDDVAPQIRAAMSASAAGLVAAGHTLVPVRAGMAWLIRGIAWELCAREAWDGYLRWRDFIVDDLTEPTRLALEVGQGVCDQRYEDIRDAQVRARADVAGWFDSQRVDAWLLPLDPDLPRRRDAPPPDRTIPSARHDRYDRTIGYTPLASFLGLPAITVPFGRTPDDAPLAMQLVGPAHSEWSLLQLGRDLAASAGNLDLALR